MSSQQIEALKRQRMQQVSMKRDQSRYAVLLILLVLTLFVLLAKANGKTGWIWMIGLAIGFTLQRSKFCFTASFRDPILVGSTSILKAILLSLMVMTLGFAIIQARAAGLSAGMPGEIDPVGLHTILGALLFGIGMVVAGGCASGTLMRIGEGFQLQLVVLIGFLIGTVGAAKSFPVWDRILVRGAPAIYYGDLLPRPIMVGLQILLLGILYRWADNFGKEHSIMVD